MKIPKEEKKTNKKNQRSTLIANADLVTGAAEAKYRVVIIKSLSYSDLTTVDEKGFHQVKRGDNCLKRSLICPGDLRERQKNVTVLFVKHNSV